MTTITLNHVSKRFPRATGSDLADIVAVDDITLKIQSGQVLALLGPSGCGKSTLLRMIAGIIAPDEGQVLYDNRPLDEVPLMDRGIGMVFQEGALIPHWEAGRSVGFFLELRHREDEVPERIQRISSITGIGLDSLLGRFPRQLSGGEKQRVAIARALSRDLAVLLFDEPFANLDAKYRAEARVELRRLLNAYPVTTVYVTHDQNEAVALSDRIGVMREGKIEQTGSYLQLRDNPVNLFVATFIGVPTINLFPGKIEDQTWVGENFGGYPIRGDLDNGVKVTAGIRPEHVHLTANGTYGVVDTVVPYYAERYQLIEVHLAGESWTLTAGLDDPIEIGSTIQCELDPAGLMFFDTRSGARIG
ncbi:MAG: ABC transporter ATP-binding protein [Anaerolineaceae bacterium]|nr:ABC transporter ATP-binding protein [Anaerolineaceae bacterium]